MGFFNFLFVRPLWITTAWCTFPISFFFFIFPIASRCIKPLYANFFFISLRQNKGYRYLSQSCHSWVWKKYLKSVNRFLFQSISMSCHHPRVIILWHVASASFTFVNLTFDELSDSMWCPVLDIIIFWFTHKQNIPIVFFVFKYWYNY